MMMQHRIEHLQEPQRLYLAWQAPDRFGQRFRWAVGVLSRNEAGCSLRYLESGPEFESLNCGRGLDEAKKLGFSGYPGLPLKDRIYGDGVLEALMRRAPPRDRADFSAYLDQFRLSQATQISDFALLAYTGAKLPSDGFSIVDPLDADVDTCERLIEVAGHRYHRTDLRVDEAVTFQPETNNEADASAVAIYRGGDRIGYVNRLKAPAFRAWLRTRTVTGVIDRVNGTQERPRAFIFVSVRPTHQAAAA
jgi:hypothetical protein